MDNLTHSLFGALIGQAGLKKKTGLAMPALIIGANLPDLDAACLFWLEGVGHLGFRRGITHGPPAMVLLPLLLAGALWWFDKWQGRRGTRPEGRAPINFKWLYLLSFLACLTHPALDWLNVYGVRLLEPFSRRWFYGDTLFIIDVWLWALMGFGTWFSLRRERQGGEWTKPARIAIAVALAYVGLNWAITASVQRDIRATVGNGPAIIARPEPLTFWERDKLLGTDHQWAILLEPQAAVEDLHAQPLTANFCGWPSKRQLETGGSQVKAFLFWSRAPFAERANDGSVLLRDARYYYPSARNRFTVALPDVKCEPLSPLP